MYPILTIIILAVLIAGLFYTMHKARRQAQLSHDERTDNPVGAMTWIYVIAAVIMVGGILLYALLRMY